MAQKYHKRLAIQRAYDSGVRKCPCCSVQLVWKDCELQRARNLATVDHIIPKSIGGLNKADNYFVMCRACNNERGEMCFVKFLTSKGYDKEKAKQIFWYAFRKNRDFYRSKIKKELSKTSNNVKTLSKIRSYFESSL